MNIKRRGFVKLLGMLGLAPAVVACHPKGEAPIQRIVRPEDFGAVGEKALNFVNPNPPITTIYDVKFRTYYSRGYIVTKEAVEDGGHALARSMRQTKVRMMSDVFKT